MGNTTPQKQNNEEELNSKKHFLSFNDITQKIGLEKPPSKSEIIIYILMFFLSYLLNKIFNVDFILTCIFFIILILAYIFRPYKKFKYIPLIFAIILFIVFILRAYNLISRSKPLNDYLIKNRAYLNCSLYIDKINGDTILYHIEVSNVNTISAKNIRYFLQYNGESESEIKDLASEMGKGGTYRIVPISNVIGGLLIGKNGLKVELICYYDSIWEGDTLHHTDEFRFIISNNEIEIKKFDPYTKEVSQIASFLEKNTAAILDQLRKKQGTIYLVWSEKQSLANSICYLISTDSLALVYLPKTQQLIFQKVLSNGKLIELVKPLTNHKGHIISLSWSGNNYNISSDNDSSIASNVIVGNALVAIAVKDTIWIGIDSEIGGTKNVVPPSGDIIKKDSIVFAFSERAGFPINVDISNIFLECYNNSNIDNLAKCFIQNLGSKFNYKESNVSDRKIETRDTVYRLNTFFVTNIYRYPVLYHTLYSFVIDSALSPIFYRIKIYPYPLVYVADKSLVTVPAKLYQTSINIMKYINPFFNKLNTTNIAELIEKAFKHESTINHSMGKGISIIRITKAGFVWIKHNQSY